MRIGLFTDTFRPSINGIVFVVEMLKKRLEEEGHEVYVFCPARSMRPSRDLEFEDEHIVRFPSIKGAFFDDYDTSIFFPPRVVQQIKDLNLDIIHIFTPSQVGLVGVQAAWKSDTPFIVQHSTDLYEFVEHYPVVLPGVLALIGIVLPFTVHLGGQDIREIIKLYKPRRGVTKWNQYIIERGITILYAKADAVIVLCRKSQDQLCSWQHHEKYLYDVTLMPNGVDALPKPSVSDVKLFRQQHGIEKDDEVFGFVGRLAAEKNLDLLIEAVEKVIRKRPQAKLMFVGDFEYRETLEAHARASKAADRIIFTGALPREQLGVAYACMKVFVFPSLKDTQGWVLHEAAHAGLPIVIIDRGLSEVAVEGKNALYAKNTSASVAHSIVTLLSDSTMQRDFSVAGKKIARRYSETRQVTSLIRLYDDVIKSHTPRPVSGLRSRLRRRKTNVPEERSF